MLLKGVEIQGFKTFVDRTRMEFGPGITVIVGPNGSGKSNIADAVQWALGEQSIKTLRGTRMDDVIFAGSDTRRLVGMAEVVLRFDNSDGSIPLDYQEVEITRRFFRSGEGEYYLNKTPCRLKDIHELLLDTGSGRGGLAIIGQGRLEEIITMRPEERRTVLEETAGIARYRLRKKEALNRLETVEQDLIRLDDLLSELKSQLRQVAVEAVRARRYKRLKRILFLLDLIVKARELDDLRRRMRKSRERLETATAEKNKYRTREEQLRAKARLLNDRRVERDRDKNHYQAELYSLQEQLVKTQGELKLVREKIDYTEKQKKEVERMELFLTEEKTSLDAVLTRLSEQKEQIEREEAELEQATSASREANEKLSTEFASLTREEEELKNSLFQVTHERVGCNNELVRLEEKRNTVERILEHKNRQLHDFRQEEETIYRALSNGQKQVDVLEEELKRLEKQKFMLETDLQLLEERLRAEEKRLADLTDRKREGETRLKILRQAQRDYEGFGAGVKCILHARGSGEPACAGVMGVVIEKLSSPPELARAVEAALGSAAQHILVRTPPEAESIIAYLKSRRQGRVTVLPLSWLEPRRWPGWAEWVLKEPGVLGIAADLVNCDPEVCPAVEYLLGQIVITENVRMAVELGEKLRPPVRLVTLDGDIVQPRGPVSGGIGRQQAGYLQRSIEIRQRQEELDELTAAFAAARQSINEVQREINDACTRHRQVSETIVVRRGEMHTMLRNFGSYREQGSHLKEKIAVLQQEMEQSAAGTAELEAKHDRLLALLAQLETREKEINRDLTVLQEHITTCQEEMSARRQELAVNSARQQLLNSAREQLEIRERELDERLIKWRQQQEELDSKREVLLEQEKELWSAHRQLYAEEEWLQGACSQMAEGLKQLEDDFLAFDKEQEELGKELLKVRESMEKTVARIQQEEVNLARLETAIDSIETEINERFGPDWEEELKNNKRRILSKNTAYLKEKAQEKIVLLGEVNTGAIAVWERLKVRYEELEQQKQDLMEGRANLRQIISEMEKLMARRLKYTFVEVQKHFNELFQELFEGGEASLELTGEDNILSAGLDIFVRPPGKKNQHLSLLSGGEKALTAAAFIFALLKVKPAAFCIFDEVDTNLDEANVERFTKLLKQFAADTQFILVSHRQGTMAAADVLYGVTMSEHGVSRLISVRLEQLPA